MKKLLALTVFLISINAGAVCASEDKANVEYSYILEFNAQLATKEEIIKVIYLINNGNLKVKNTFSISIDGQIAQLIGSTNPLGLCKQELEKSVNEQITELQLIPGVRLLGNATIKAF